MTDVVFFQSSNGARELSVRTRKSAADATLRTTSLRAQLAGGVVALLCLTLPDSVVHAKVFKLNMVVDNIHQRCFGQGS